MVALVQEDFEAFLLSRRRQWFANATIELQGHEVRVNPTLLACRSTYFRHLFEGNWKEGQTIRLSLPSHYSIVVDVLLNFAMLGVLVIPCEFSTSAWMELAELADYFCMHDLTNICQNHLSARLNGENHSELERFSCSMGFKHLQLHCANYELRHSLKTKELKKKVSTMRECDDENSCFLQLYETLHFDLLHNNQVEPFLKLKKNSESETMIEEKENNREYTNA